MPVIKSARKRLKQARKRQVRNYAIRSHVKTYIKKVINLCKEKKKNEAVLALKETYKIIDTACKKNILHRNNAARKKSRIAKMVNKLEVVKEKEEK